MTAPTDRDRAEAEALFDDLACGGIGGTRDDVVALIATALAAARRDGEAFTPTHRHYKGGLYQVLRKAAEHTETGEALTVYRGADGNVWVRPTGMFNERLKDGQPRFTPLATAIRQPGQEEP